jgi:hypothetical protein
LWGAKAQLSGYACPRKDRLVPMAFGVWVLSWGKVSTLATSAFSSNLTQSRTRVYGAGLSRAQVSAHLGCIEGKVFYDVGHALLIVFF